MWTQVSCRPCWCTSLVYKMATRAVQIGVKVRKGKGFYRVPSILTNGGRQKRPLARRSPERSFLELPASPEVLPVSKVGAIPMPVCSCDESPGCSIGKSISLYLSMFVPCEVHSKNLMKFVVVVNNPSICTLRSIVKYILLTSNSLTKFKPRNWSAFKNFLKVYSVSCASAFDILKLWISTARD